MSGYPIVLTGLAARRCLIVGGGTVAARKAEALLEAGAQPVVISPELSPELEAMAAAGRVREIKGAHVDPRDVCAGDVIEDGLVVSGESPAAVGEFDGHCRGPCVGCYRFCSMISERSP